MSSMLADAVVALAMSITYPLNHVYTLLLIVLSFVPIILVAGVLATATACVVYDGGSKRMENAIPFIFELLTIVLVISHSSIIGILNLYHDIWRLTIREQITASYVLLVVFMVLVGTGAAAFGIIFGGLRDRRDVPRALKKRA